MFCFFNAYCAKPIMALALLSLVSCGGQGGDDGAGNSSVQQPSPSVQKIIGPSGGQIELSGYAMLNVPAGTLSSETTVTAKISDVEKHSTFSDLDDDGSLTSPYIIHINLGSVMPKNHTITIDMPLPKDWVSLGVAAEDVRALCDWVYVSEAETLITPERMDAVLKIIDNKTVRMALPIEAFSSHNTVDGTFQANCVLDTKPLAIKKSDQTLTFRSSTAHEISSPFLWAPHHVTSAFSPSRIHPTLGTVRPHKGLDAIRQERTDPYATVGQDIYPIAPGEVYRLRQQRNVQGKLVGYGEYVILKHTNLSPPIYSLYAHLGVGSSTSPWGGNLKIGQLVDKTSPLGIMGGSGTSSGRHLHIEVRPIEYSYGKPLDFFECQPIDPVSSFKLFEFITGTWHARYISNEGKGFDRTFFLKQSGRKVQGTEKHDYYEENRITNVYDGPVSFFVDDDLQNSMRDLSYKYWGSARSFGNSAMISDSRTWPSVSVYDYILDAQTKRMYASSFQDHETRGFFHFVP